jgi:hypothetical protein
MVQLYRTSKTRGQFYTIFLSEEEEEEEEIY